jgi:hypothetical protein
MPAVMVCRNDGATVTCPPLSAVSSYLDGYGDGYYTQRGYTVLLGENWSSYATSAAVHAAYNWGSSWGCPPTAHITKMATGFDPVFPHCIEELYPYNDDHPDSGSSLGAHFQLTIPWGAEVNRVWFRRTWRFGGSQHPTRPSPSNFNAAVGLQPSGDGNDIKDCFWGVAPGVSGTVRIGNSLGDNSYGVFNLGWGGVQRTEARVTEAGHTTTYGAGGTKSATAHFTGQHVYEWTEEFHKVTDNLWIWRIFHQQLTLAGVWDPQPIEFEGWVVQRTGGDLFQGSDRWIWKLNKNKTTGSDGLSSTSWDLADTFRLNNSISTARAENTKPWRGHRRYHFAWFGITGGNGHPFDDHLGRNLDEYGRNHASWPGGVP